MKRKNCVDSRMSCSCGICNSSVNGRPKYLSVYAPVVYDEIGVNICRPVTIPEAVMTANPTVSQVQIDVVDIAFTVASEGIPATTVTNTVRANCTTVVLTNVSVTFRVKLFGDCNNFLTSTIIAANYLPGSSTSPEVIHERGGNDAVHQYRWIYAGCKYRCEWYQCQRRCKSNEL